MDLYSIQPPITIPHQNFDLGGTTNSQYNVRPVGKGKGLMSFLLGDGRLTNLTKATKFHE